MSNIEGSTTYNSTPSDSAVISLQLAANCGEVTAIFNNAIANFNGLLGAVTAQLSAVTAQLAQTQSDAETLAADIAAIAGWQTAQTELSTMLAGAVTLPAIPTSIVAYLQLQATAMITVNNASLARIIKELLKLNADYNRFTRDISTLEAKVATLTAQVTAIPADITAIGNAAATAAARFPGCVLP